MEKITLIIAVFSSLLSLGLIGVLRKFIKELKELVNKYNEYKEGGFTEKELLSLADESMDVIREGIKLWNIIKKTFKKK